MIAIRRLLFLGSLLLVPLPMVTMVPALVPAARYLELVLICLITIVLEGTGGIVGLLMGLLLLHGLAYALLLWVVSGLFVRLLVRLSPRLLLPATILLLVGGLIAAGVGEPYTTPFATTVRAGFPGVYR